KTASRTVATSRAAGKRRAISCVVFGLGAPLLHAVRQTGKVRSREVVPRPGHVGSHELSERAVGACPRVTFCPCRARDGASRGCRSDGGNSLPRALRRWHVGC